MNIVFNEDIYQEEIDPSNGEESKNENHPIRIVQIYGRPPIIEIVSDNAISSSIEFGSNESELNQREGSTELKAIEQI